MPDFPIVSTGILNYSMQPTLPVKKQAVVPAYQAEADSAGTRNTGLGSQKLPTKLERYLARKAAENRPAGPPPAFQANLLEIETNLEYQIKQRAHPEFDRDARPKPATDSNQ